LLSFSFILSIAISSFEKKFGSWRMGCVLRGFSPHEGKLKNLRRFYIYLLKNQINPNLPEHTFKKIIRRRKAEDCNLKDIYAIISPNNCIAFAIKFNCRRLRFVAFLVCGYFSQKKTSSLTRLQNFLPHQNSCFLPFSNTFSHKITTK